MEITVQCEAPSTDRTWKIKVDGQPCIHVEKRDGIFGAYAYFNTLACTAAVCRYAPSAAEAIELVIDSMLAAIEENKARFKSLDVKKLVSQIEGENV